MPYIPFQHICPNTAEKETRMISLLHNDNQFNLPKGDYYFLELFCNECDCRRVFLQVVMNQEIVATVSYGWEKLSFYRKQFKGFSEKDIREIKGPIIDSFQYQSDVSDRILKMFNKILLTDKMYMNRIKKHYDQFKKTLRTNRN